MNEIYLSPGTPSAPEPVEYEDMTREERIKWLVDEAKLSARPHMTDAAHILAAQLVAAEELRDELVRALDGLLVGCEYKTILGCTDWHRIAMPKKNALTAARAALAKARTGG